MPYDPSRHRRRSIRLPGYDYTRPGHYFVTICTAGRRPLFDDPALRQIAEEQWAALARAGERGMHGPRVAVDAWVVMPDHVHGIIAITAAGRDRRPANGGGEAPGATARGLGIHVSPGSLGAVVRSYKAAAARRINRAQRTPGGEVWQRGYWERIIRDERELDAVRRYIAANPAIHARRAAHLDALLARMTPRG